MREQFTVDGRGLLGTTRWLRASGPTSDGLRHWEERDRERAGMDADSYDGWLGGYLATYGVHPALDPRYDEDEGGRR